MDMMLLLLIFGIFLGFFVQTIIGFGAALISLPILLYVMPLSEGVAYLSIFNLISTPFYIYKEWKYIDRKLLKELALSSGLGVLLGILILVYGHPILLKKALGVFILLFVINSLIKRKEIKLFPIMKPIFGFLGGFFSGVFSTGGPLYVIVVKDETTDIRVFRATMFGVLGFVTLIRIPALAMGEVLTIGQLHNSLIVLPFFILALYVGKKIYLKLNENLMRKFILGSLFISGIMLIIKG